MRAFSLLVLFTMLLASLALTACSQDAGPAGSTADVSSPQDASGQDGVDTSAAATSAWPAASAKAIHDLIAPLDLEMIGLRRIFDMASRNGLVSDLEQLQPFLTQISSTGLGSNRLADEPIFVAVADGLLSGERVPTADLLDLLLAIAEGP